LASNLVAESGANNLALTRESEVSAIVS